MVLVAPEEYKDYVDFGVSKEQKDFVITVLILLLLPLKTVLTVTRRMVTISSVNQSRWEEEGMLKLFLN